jgi:tRNA (adenine22-N1)-methyltransferase
MENFDLSKRLEKVAQYVNKGARLADIGSDHAYLPCALAEKEYISFAVAGEVVQGPFKRAQQEVRSRGLEKIIDVRLGDGLDVLLSDDRINTVTICGMGGVLIRQILESGLNKGKIAGSQHLILQPNVGEEELRYFLKENNYQIVSEELIEENDKLYEIIVAKPSNHSPEYSENELRYGPYLLKEKSSLFIKKWTKEKEKLEFVKQQIERSSNDQSEKLKQLTTQINEIEELIK